MLKVERRPAVIRKKLGIKGTREALDMLPREMVIASTPPHAELILAVERVSGGATNYNDLVAALRRY